MMSRVTPMEDQIVDTFLRETFNDENNHHNSNPNMSSLSSANGGAFIQEEDDGTALSDDIRKMAQALAPQMCQLEDVLKDFSETEKLDAAELADTSRSMMEDEDDDLDEELTQLAMSEQALREELEFAAGMSLLGSPVQKIDHLEEIGQRDLPTPTRLNPIDERLHQPTQVPNDFSSDEAPAVYTLQDHAEYLKLRTERVGGWYYCDMTSKFLPALSGSEVAHDLVKDYCLPIPFRKLKRLYTGLVFHDVLQHTKKPPAMTPSRDANKSANTPTRNTTSSHDPPVTPVTSALISSAPILRTPKTPAEARSHLQSNPSHNVEEPLPVRTVAIRVRPDVLCGAIMDAVHHAFEILPSNCTTRVLKRQGGHLRGAVYVPDMQVAYVVDIQLCTQKNDDLERRLIVRYYHVQDDPEALQELAQTLQQIQQQVPPSPDVVENTQRRDNSLPTVTSNTSGLSSLTNSTYTVASTVVNSAESDVIAQEKLAANRHLKQSCSLIQRLMAAQQQGGIQEMDLSQQKTWLGLRDIPFDSKWAMQRSIGKHLESNFKSCPSVREENKKANPTIRRLTLPSLSAKDWSLLDVSWTLTGHIVEELDTRDCTFNTLSTLPFGQFPSLPTLDVQYCSQLRRLSRENMITQLLKAAKDLEDYAGIAEYNCAVCITLLAPFLEFYGVPPLQLPKAKSLDEYPLEYAPPQQACPPWGTLVMESLNIVASKTPTGEIDVVEAVRMVYHAFTKQDDEEQGARLGRKNAQIMERLASMQSYQRALIRNIQDSHVYSQLAAEAASSFLKRAQVAFNSRKEGYPGALREEVPLLDFKISLGASKSGRCYVTANQILFTTSYIPIVGSISSILFDLTKIDFEVDPNPASSLLNPFPNTMNVILKSTREVVYSFRPAIGPDRLQTFMTVIQSFAIEASPSEYSRVVNDSQVIEDDGQLQLVDSEDQLYI
ncbi:hypothetical protein IV203_029862 [Nitzschia inconspicua]|uniref:Uncharacterized protein n=1 Tax=Nitzschia inconspicua TaxID=303405 RepID=A0A9K3LRU4_9STRA|nr:hypothetical protein IV203_029862 [Nitzschia inconspicua]